MRYLTISLAILIVTTSCSTMKNTSSVTTRTPSHKDKKPASPEFIENISIKPIKGNESVAAPPLKKESNSGVSASTDKSSIEFASPTLLKYAILMNAPVEELNNEKLIHFIDDWYGTKYRFGGEDRNGVDCSAFVQSFMLALYGLNVPRTSKEQYLESERIRKSDLTEGDMIFFHTRGRSKAVSHVGVYLRNNKFIHASSSGGVMISDLDEPYFKHRYVGSGRVREQ